MTLGAQPVILHHFDSSYLCVYIFCVLVSLLKNDLFKAKIEEVHAVFRQFRAFPSISEQALMALEHMSLASRKIAF